MIEGETSISKLRDQFSQSVLDMCQFRGETTVIVRAADILPICRFLRDDPDQAYDLCLFVSAIDRLDLGLSPRFEAVYPVSYTHLTLPTKRIV